MPTPLRPAPSPTAADDDLIDALVQATFVVTAALSKVGAEHDLSLTQLRVLAILRDRRVRMTALADYLGLEKSTMSGLVDRAERRGLLRRSANAVDGRAVDVFLSADGVALTDRVYQHVQRALAPLTGRLTAGDRQRLQTVLARMLREGE